MIRALPLWNRTIERRRGGTYRTSVYGDESLLRKDEVPSIHRIPRRGYIHQHPTLIGGREGVQDDDALFHDDPTQGVT